jgi:hypothetical protein
MVPRFCIRLQLCELYLSAHGRSDIPAVRGGCWCPFMRQHSFPDHSYELGVEYVKLSQILDSKDDTELGAMMRDRFTRLLEAHSMGLGDEPPAASWNAHNKILRDHKVAKDAAGSGLGSRELEENDHSDGAQDDDDPTGPNPPRAPERKGKSVAAHDSLALELARIRQSGTANLEAELHLARTRRIDPVKVRAMTKAIPGYGRLK